MAIWNVSSSDLGKCFFFYRAVQHRKIWYTNTWRQQDASLEENGDVATCENGDMATWRRGHAWWEVQRMETGRLSLWKIAFRRFTNFTVGQVRALHIPSDFKKKNNRSMQLRQAAKLVHSTWVSLWTELWGRSQVDAQICLKIASHHNLACRVLSKTLCETVQELFTTGLTSYGNYVIWDHSAQPTRTCERRFAWQKLAIWTYFAFCTTVMLRNQGEQQ